MSKKKILELMSSHYFKLLWPPSTKVPSTLILLALMTTLTPITGTYTFLFLLLMWLTLGLRTYSSPMTRFEEFHTSSINKSDVEDLYRHYLKPFNIGITLFACFQIVSAIGAYFTSEFAPSAMEVFKTTWHLIGKWLAIWIVLSQSIAILLRYHWTPRSLLKPFLYWVFFYTLYCFAQRIWGFDWVKGLGAALGPHRFAYGVYRISGLMGHPLTLTYNLMIIFLMSFCLDFSEQRTHDDRQEKNIRDRLISWKSVTLLSGSILIASGSRFVLLIIPPALIFGYIKPLRQFFRKIFYSESTKTRIKMVLFCLLFSSAIFFLGKSSINRFGELIDPNIPWHDRWPRLLYWEIHWELFLSHPIFGTSVAKVSEAAQSFGLGRTGSLENMNAHNLFIQFLADSGMVGFLGLCILLGSLIIGSRNTILPPITRYGMTSIIIGLAGSSISQNVLRDSEFVFALWASLAILMAQGSVDSANRLMAGKYTSIFGSRALGNEVV